MHKFTFLADLHYYSKTLGTSGRAYELRSGSDQKCLAESGAIIDAAFDHLARSDTQAVLLAGEAVCLGREKAGVPDHQHPRLVL